jgi:ankyrin repeat protein
LDDDALYEHLDAQEDWTEEEETSEVERPHSQLLSLVQSYDWAGTLARIACFPHEARAIGHQGRTPLHKACDHDAPSVVVQSLLRAYPEASTKVGTTLMNPLHITCSSPHASVHVVRILLDGGDAYQTSMRDVDGDTPLHTACRCGAPMEVLEVLLRANPATVHQRDYEGLTPVLRLWVRYFVILGDDVIDNVRGAADVVTGELGEAWKKTELLLRCAHHGSLPPPWTMGPIDESEKVFRVLHAAAAVDCPRAVVKIATILHSHQLEERDEDGMTPLIIACKAPIFKVRDLSDKGYLLEDRIHGDDNNNDALPAISKDDDDDEEATVHQPSVIEILLQAPLNPERQLCNIACIPSPCGRLPLNWAIVSGKKWNEGIKALVEAYPDALGMVDMETGLYPFMLAASTVTSTETTTTSSSDAGDECTTTSTIFELLRLDPSLASTRGKE